MANRARKLQDACRLRYRDQLLLTTPSRRSILTRPGDSSPSTRSTPPRCKARSTSVQFKTPGRAGTPHRPQSRHASTTSGPSRRAVTVTTDDGRYNWNELSRGEKAARGTQQTFNFLLVSLGLVGTVGRLPPLLARTKLIPVVQPDHHSISPIPRTAFPFLLHGTIQRRC